jgi:hypothetical protein
MVGVSFLAIPRIAAAQGTDLPPPPPPPPPAPAVEAPPTPATTPAASTATAGTTTAVAEPEPELSGTGTPNPNGMGSGGSDWRFTWHGYLRAPMRIGMSDRPSCPSGSMPGTAVNQSGKVLGASDTIAGLPVTGIACAGPGQAGTSFHTPMVPDDQYLAWSYANQLPKDWTEVFLNYGNDQVVGTVGLQGFGFTDAEYNHNYAAQFGISQGYVTITPQLPVPNLKAEIKVGSFWNKYGMAGQYDAGKYDTYLFARTHMMGEVIKGEYKTGAWRFRLEDGFGTKSEQIAVGNPIAPAPMVATSGGVTAEGMPGFSLLHHAHAGFSYKELLDVNFHYLAGWSQDDRIATTTNGGLAGGQETIMGAEAHVWGGAFGNFYLGYATIDAQQVEYVAPILETVHSMGGGGAPQGGSSFFFDQGYGIIDNYLGYCASCASPKDQGTGRIQTVEAQYDMSFGGLYRKLTTGAGFWGDGSDMTLSLFMMYNAIDTRDGTMPTQKLKYGADFLYTPLKWFGIGIRLDEVNPNLTNDGSTANQNQDFTAIGPKLVFKSKFITHEEIIANWVHYTYAKNVLPQLPYNGGLPGSGSGFPVYYPDQNAFGLRATMWW